MYEGFKTFLADINFPTPIHTPKRILQGGHLMDEFLHAVRAFLAHPVGHMAVDVKGKRCGGVAEIFLNGLDIVAVFQGDDRVGVSQIMEAACGKTEIGC